MDYMPMSTWTKRRKRKAEAEVAVHLQEIKKEYEDAQTYDIAEMFDSPSDEYSNVTASSTCVSEDPEYLNKQNSSDVQNIGGYNDGSHSRFTADSESEDKVYNDDVSCSSNDNQDNASLSEQLADWAVEHNITHEALTALLEILRNVHPKLPKTAKALFRTKQDIANKKVAGGSIHFAISESVADIADDDIDDTSAAGMFLN